MRILLIWIPLLGVFMSIILAVLALVAFAIAAIKFELPRVNLIALGLFLWLLSNLARG